jgi:hypothetical protein
MATATPPAITPQALRLRALAERHAQPLLTDGNHSVAVTGSVGRGDSEAGSDIDLWVLGEHDRVEHCELEGVQITVMHESWDKVTRLEHLARIEPQWVWVIHDPGGRFAELRAVHDRRRDEIHAARIAATEERIWWLLEQSHDGSVGHRLEALRFAAWTMIGLHLYVTSGQLSVKYRHLRAALDEDTLALVDSILGLQHPEPAARALASQVEVVTAKIVEAVQSRLGISWSVPRPVEIGAVVAAGHFADALVRARAFFREVCRVPLEDRLKLDDFHRFVVDELAGPIATFWVQMNRLDAAPDVLELQLAQTRSELQQVCTRLDRVGGCNPQV